MPNVELRGVVRWFEIDLAGSDTVSGRQPDKTSGRVDRAGCSYGYEKVRCRKLSCYLVHSHWRFAEPDDMRSESPGFTAGLTMIGYREVRALVPQSSASQAARLQ